MENHHFKWENSLSMVIFHSFLYVYQRVLGKSTGKSMGPQRPPQENAERSERPRLAEASEPHAWGLDRRDRWMMFGGYQRDGLETTIYSIYMYIYIHTWN